MLDDAVRLNGSSSLLSEVDVIMRAAKGTTDDNSGRYATAAGGSPSTEPINEREVRSVLQTSASSTVLDKMFVHNLTEFTMEVDSALGHLKQRLAQLLCSCDRRSAGIGPSVQLCLQREALHYQTRTVEVQSFLTALKAAEDGHQSKSTAGAVQSLLSGHAPVEWATLLGSTVFRSSASTQPSVQQWMQRTKVAVRTLIEFVEIAAAQSDGEATFVTSSQRSDRSPSVGSTYSSSSRPVGEPAGAVSLPVLQLSVLSQPVAFISAMLEDAADAGGTSPRTAAATRNAQGTSAFEIVFEVFPADSGASQAAAQTIARSQQQSHARSSVVPCSTLQRRKNDNNGTSVATASNSVIHLQRDRRRGAVVSSSVDLHQQLPAAICNVQSACGMVLELDAVNFTGNACWSSNGLQDETGPLDFIGVTTADAVCRPSALRVVAYARRRSAVTGGDDPGTPLNVYMCPVRCQRYAEHKGVEYELGCVRLPSCEDGDLWKIRGVRLLCG
eukprot:Lankesteria_metandrocarpae@DN8327_c0_g1_i1.p1